MKPVLANLGFVLQTAGLLILLAVLVAFIYDEHEAIISFFISSVVFLAAGFLLNALCERKELDFKSSCTLVSLVFFLLGLVGSIPYLYTGTFQSPSFIEQMINSYFESISGYTTTGLSLVANPEFLPKSIVFYRSLTQWVGGIGIVFIVLAFFYSDSTLNKFSKAIGFEKITSTIKKSYIEVFFIYTLYVIIFFGIFYLLGLRDAITNISIVFSTISTGGFSPASNISTLLPFPNSFILNILMILGATSFVLHHRWLTGNFRNSLTKEFLAMISIILLFTLLVSATVKVNISTAFFDVASSSTTTGYNLMNIRELSDAGKALFIILIFIGGCAFSTAGGIKIIRLLVFLKSIPWTIKGLVTGSLDKFTFEGKEFTNSDVLSYLLLIILAGLMIFIFSVVFIIYGFDFIDSIFETTSALANTGSSVGITNVSLPSVLKIILTLLMVLGRIEIIPLLVAVTPKTKEEPKSTSNG